MDLDVVQALFTSLLISAGVVFVLARRPPDHLSPHLLLVELSALLFVFSDLGFNLSSSGFWATIWVSGIYSGVLALSVAWFELVSQYARIETTSLRLPGTKTIVAVRFCAGAIWLLMASNSMHGQFVELRDRSANLYHWGFWLHAGFSYLLMAATVVILGSVWRNLPNRHSRHQVAILMMAPLVLLLTNLLHVTSHGELPMDPTVGGVGLSAMIFLAGVYGVQLFDLTPTVLRQVVRLSRDCVFIVDGEFFLRYANHAATENFAPDELASGVRFCEMLARKFDTEPTTIASLLTANAEASNDLVYLKSAEGRYWLLEPLAVRARSGRIVCYAATLRDVTRRVEAERLMLEGREELEQRVSERTANLAREIEMKEGVLEALSQSEARYKGLLETSPLGVIACDREGWIIAANRCVWKQLQIDEPDDFTGLDIDFLAYRGSIGYEVVVALKRCIASGEPRTTDVEYRPGGELNLALCIHLAPFRDQDGKTQGVQCVIEDVTARNRARDDLVQTRIRLEALIARQSLSLEESRDHLRESERLSSIGILAAGVAHQINNPVGSILVSAEYALDCEDEPDVIAIWKRALSEIVDQASRCGKIVRSLLQFSRGEATAMWVEDANEIVRRSCRTTRAYADDRNCTIVETLDDQPSDVLLSPIKIEQVVVNVLRNAIESRASGITIEVRTKREASLFCIRITDDGPGIDPDDLGHIFEPFFSTRIREGGTGLGLSVAHGIVEVHGGAMSATSEPGNGTTILVELPLAAGDHATPRSA